MKRLLTLFALLLWAAPASAQQEVDASAIYLGLTGSVCKGTTGSAPASPSTCDWYVNTTDGKLYMRWSTGAWVAAGSVYSVGNGTIGTLFAVSWSTATTTPALNLNFATQGANCLLAGPTSGGAAVPTCRTMVLADVPDSLLTDAKVNASGITTRSKLPSAIAYEDEANTFSQAQAFTGLASHLIPTLTDTFDIGSFDKLWSQGYLSQLNAVLFALETQTLFGGYSTIGHDAGALGAAVSSGATTVDFGKTMTPGDFIVIRGQDTGGTYTVEYMTVGSNTAGTIYNVTRNLSGAGAKNWASGLPFLVLGQNGDGRIDLFAYDGKPKIVFTTQGATYNAQTIGGVVGNLNGYYNYATDIIGAGFGASAGLNVTVDPTNGFRIRSGTTNKFVADASGNLSLVGDLVLGTAGVLRSGATTYASGTGWIFEYNGGTPRGRIGNPAGNYIGFDGTNVTIVGSITVTGGNAATTTYVDTAESDAVAAAASDATTKANAAQSTAISTASSDATTKANAAAAASLDRATFLDTIPGTIKGTLITGSSITTSQIAANTIVAGNIAANTITAAKIAANTITAAEIAAGTITATQIATNTITATQIAADAITSSEIAADAVTASKIDVATLSAIVVNTGALTVQDTLTISTSGNIVSGASSWGSGDGYILEYNGGSPRLRIGSAGSGERFIYEGGDLDIVTNTFTLNSTTGLAFENAEDDGPHAISWGSNGAHINGSNSRLRLRGTATQINLDSVIRMWGYSTDGNATIIIDSDQMYTETGIGLGASGSPFTHLYLEPGSTTASQYPLVLIDSIVSFKTDGYDGSGGCSGVDDIQVELGIVVGITCTSTSVTSRVVSLEAEVADLRAQVQQLLALVTGRRQ